MADPGRILLVDDEESMCEMLSVVLRRDGYEVLSAHSGDEALRAIHARPVDLVISDLKMPGMTGIDLLRQVKTSHPTIPFVVMTAYETWDTAVEAMRLGAFDYVKKPFDNRDIRNTVERALRPPAMREGRSTRQDELIQARLIVGSSPKTKAVLDLIRRVAPTDSTVLVSGESGTGKELVARALHLGSTRANESFLSVNCGAFTDTLLESELFGHAKGSFTGAIADKKGLFEVADKGTFFLDEVSEMSVATQVKLLRVLEEREFKPVGSTETRKVDVRMIAATNRRLEEEVTRGTFRKDLYYRLNVIAIDLPPLRDRRDDIPLLAGHFLAKYSKLMKKNVLRFTEDALEALVAYSWPGNVRELENTVQRALALTESNEIRLADFAEKIQQTRGSLPFEPMIPPAGIDLEKTLGDLEKSFLEKALALSGGNLTEAGKLLNLKFRQMRYKVKKYELRKDAELPDEG